MTVRSQTIEIDSKSKQLLIKFTADEGLKQTMRQIAQSKWSGELQGYLVPTQFLISVINNFPGFARSQEVEDLCQAYKTKKLNAIKISNNLINTHDFTQSTNGRVPFPHQGSGAIDILTKIKCILADEMGLGKTATSLMALGTTGLPIYIIAPKNLHDVWIKEARVLNVVIEPVISWAKIGAPPAGEFCLIADEAHASQSMLSSRTKNFLQFADQASYMVCISGTPIKNGRPANLFAMLTACKHPLSFNRRFYEQMYCGASSTKSSKWDAVGATNLDELYLATKDIFIRREKKDCLNLPEKIRIMRPALLTAHAAETYEKVFNALRDRWLNRVSNKEIVDSNAKLVMFTQLRHAASWAKLDEAAKLAEEHVENKQKTVFFTAFAGTAKALRDKISKFATCGLIVGDVPLAERQRYIDAFQEKSFGDPTGYDVIVCTFDAGGIGITLTASSYSYLVDRPWTPGGAFQAEDRTHRIGSKDTVFAIWIQANQTDQKIDDLLLKKQRNISEILTGNREKLQLEFDQDLRSNLDEVFDSIFD